MVWPLKTDHGWVGQCHAGVLCFVSTLECESRCRFLPWRQIRWWLEVKLILPGFYLDWIMPWQPNMAGPSPCTCHTWIFWYHTTTAAAPCHRLWHIILQFSKGPNAFQVISESKEFYPSLVHLPKRHNNSHVISTKSITIIQWTFPSFRTAVNYFSFLPVL